MRTGFEGTFVIAWDQTDLDGQPAGPVHDATAGATWCWHGEAMRLDGPQALLRLEGEGGRATLRPRIAQRAPRLIGAEALGEIAAALSGPDDHDPSSGIVLTDGLRRFAAELIRSDKGALLVFSGGLPEPEAELWIVRSTIRPTQAEAGNPFDRGVICFSAGTRIATPLGPRAIDELRPGDLILTLDDGPQPVVWTGSRRMTGARLFAMPQLRPVRIRAGAFGTARPDDELLVSPHHRMLVRGAAAMRLFNTPEVLVAAQDLVDGRAVSVDAQLREVTYVHVALDRHQIVWANGLETESFHPAGTSLDTLDPGQRDALLSAFPDIARNVASYGDFARRNLAGWETAILRHELAA